MKNRVLKTIASVCMMVTMVSLLNEPCVKADAADRQLNIEVCFGTTETAQYGVPNAFTNRNDRITARVHSVYMAAFNIHLNFSQPDTNYVVSSPADTCRLYNDFDAFCTHTTNSACMNANPYHCTNASHNVLNLFWDKPTTGRRYLLITASKLCLGTTNSSGQQIHGEALGLNTGFAGGESMVVRDYDYVKEENAHITNWLGNYENTTWVSKTVAHEIGHFYGVEDHYDTIYGDERDYCIWGYR